MMSGCAQGLLVVPEKKAYIMERFGKFTELLPPGIHFRLPIVNRVAYVHSLKEEAITIANQTAITKDNVVIGIDGILYVRVVDAELASYVDSDSVLRLAHH